MLEEELEATAGKIAVQSDAVVVISPVVNLSVLSQVGQNASVGDFGLDLGLEGPFTRGLHGRPFPVVRALHLEPR